MRLCANAAEASWLGVECIVAMPRGADSHQPGKIRHPQLDSIVEQPAPTERRASALVRQSLRTQRCSPRHRDKLDMSGNRDRNTDRLELEEQ